MAFLDFRDYSGVVQVVVRGDEIVHDLRDEWCVAITGVVRARLDGKVNPALPTGEIEVVASQLDVLNPSAPLPFPIDDSVNVGDETRLRYRYLDLRRGGTSERDPAAQ